MTDILKLIPPMLTGAELHKALAVNPEYDPAIRHASAAERLMALNTLYDIYYPFSIGSTVYTKLYLAMIRSLQRKTGKLAVQQRNSNYFGRGQSYFGISNSDSFSIVGMSGVGKSSAISRAIALMEGDRVITLDSPYCKILPVLVVQTPFDCSTKSLFLSILKAIDDALDTTYYQSASKGRVSTPVLLSIVCNACAHISVLIVDELQNVANSRNGASLIGSLIQLVNSCPVSTVFVACNEVLPILEQDPKLARRALGIQVGEVPFDADFVGFCETLYRYKYVSGDMVLTDGIIQWLYEHSGCGNVAAVVSILQAAQEIAILDGTETVTIETLNKAYSQRLGLLHSHIDLARVKMTAKRESAPKLPTATELVPSFEKGLLAQIVAEAKRKELSALDLMKQRITIVEVSV